MTRKNNSANPPAALSSRPSKKSIILEEAAALGVKRFRPADLDELRRRVASRLGGARKTSQESLASVLEDAGYGVVRSARTDTGGKFDAEFRHLLEFASLSGAEQCLARLGAMLSRFQQAGERAAVERVFETARLGRQRAERIARNSRVAAAKRAEKAEIAQWFRVWLELPDAFAAWLELRKASAAYKEKFEISAAAGR